jgi:hypothetical protein
LFKQAVSHAFASGVPGLAPQTLVGALWFMPFQPWAL